MPSYGVSQDVVPGNLNIQGSLILPNVTDAITAKAGGGQQTTGVSVIPANTSFFRVATVGTAADSVTLPNGVTAGGVGSEIVVFNSAAANSMNVFPALGDNINLLGANAAFAVAAGKSCSFVVTSVVASTGVSRWSTMLSA